MCASPIYNSFAKAGTKPIEYLDKPFDFSGALVNKEDLEEKEIQDTRLRTYLYLNSWASAINSKGGE